MIEKKLKILSEFKTPLPLSNADRIKVLLPYDDGRTLEKTSVSVLDADSGTIKLSLSDFELQGMKVGEISFICKVYMKDGTRYDVRFNTMIDLDEKSGRKVWR